MPPKRSADGNPPPRWCHCGHPPSEHMSVRPVAEGVAGSFQLLPTGGCARCGASCPAFRPVP